MKLPNHEQALVPEAKITEYLLSDTHPKGKDKAIFFKMFGFSVVFWEVLAKALLQHITDFEVQTTKTTPHCTNYVIEGQLQTPSGKTPMVRSVWCIRHDDTIPYLVTAYPLEAEMSSEENKDDGV